MSRLLVPRPTLALLGLMLCSLAACNDSGDDGTGPSASLSMTLAPASGTVVKGNSAQTAIVVTRNNYAGALTFTVEGATAGVTGSVGASETTGNTTTALVTLATTTAAATGVVPLTIRAHGDGVTDVTKTFTLTISPPAQSNTVNLSVAACGNKPIWLAAQDGTFPFARVLPIGDVYSFELTSARGRIASVTTSTGGGYSLTVYDYDRARLLTGTFSVCTPASVTITGTLAGVPGGASAAVSLGGGDRTLLPAGAFSLPGVRVGTWDMTAFLRGAALDESGNRFLIRRDQAVTVPASLGTIDLQGGESFAAVSAPMTITGMVAGETPSLAMYYHTQTNNRCSTNTLYTRTLTAPAFTASGIAPAQQLATDYHEAFVSATEANFDYRGVGAIFHTMATRTIPLPSVFPAVTVTSAGGLYRRLQTTVTIPTDYAGASTFQYFQSGGASRAVSLITETATSTGQPATFAIPDFSAVSGWDNSWGPSPTLGGQWLFYAYSGATGCVEGTRYTFANRGGFY